MSLKKDTETYFNKKKKNNDKNSQTEQIKQKKYCNYSAYLYEVIQSV